MKIKRAALKDLPDLFNLLKECELPVDGVVDHLEHFLVLKANGKICGCIGLEIYEHSCLLRSLAVSHSEQGKGYGRMLVGEILRLIEKKKIKKVYLLTTDAEDYFKRFDFQVIDRKKADSEIQKTLQFTSVCCQSAVCMVKTME